MLKLILLWLLGWLIYLPGCTIGDDAINQRAGQQNREVPEQKW